MDVTDFAAHILMGEKIEDKLIDSLELTFETNTNGLVFAGARPARNNSIMFSDKQLKFPKAHFERPEEKAKALHSFANHELLAIETMALALYIFPHHTKEMVRFKKGIVKSLRDEQKHFLLYTQRLNELGYAFGDFPLNDYFWRRLSTMKTPDEYMAVMALTFEAANLDFAKQFMTIFAEQDDFVTANIMQTVYKDEISHVAFGAHFMNIWKKDKSLWEYYLEVLPSPLTPARSKGKHFDFAGRMAANLDESFIASVRDFKDDFLVTNRKDWKK